MEPKISAGTAINCCFDERLIARTALQHLREHGHQKIGYLGQGVDDWENRRQVLLGEEAAEMGMELITAPSARARLRKLDPGDVVSHLTRYRLTGSSACRKCIQYLWNALGLGSSHLSMQNGNSTRIHDFVKLLQAMPDDENERVLVMKKKSSLFSGFDLFEIFRCADQIIPVLLCPGITANIAPRDRSVPRFIEVFNKMGIAIPDDLSMVSFDNEPNTAYLSVSSVDFGARDLGYRAFHTLLRDIRVSIDIRRCQLIATPHVVERGSVMAIT